MGRLVHTGLSSSLAAHVLHYPPLERMCCLLVLNLVSSTLKRLRVEPEDREVTQRSSNVTFIAVSHVRGRDGWIEILSLFSNKLASVHCSLCLAPSQHRRPTTIPATVRQHRGLPPMTGHQPSHPQTKRQSFIVETVELIGRGTTARLTTTTAAPGRRHPPAYARCRCTCCSSQSTFLQMTSTVKSIAGTKAQKGLLHGKLLCFCTRQ